MDVEVTLRNMLIVNIVLGLVLIFQHRLGFDMSQAALCALGFLYGTFNLAVGYIQAHQPPPTSTNPPTVP